MAPPQLPDRPDFRLPFEAGVTVSLTTYVGHNPDDKKIDMFRLGMPTGSPIMASAGGVVHEQFDPGGIEIRHGLGWFTVYLHMSWHVAPGTVVARGDRIGTMGSVGTQVAHLHYEQLYNPHSDQDADNEHIVNPVLQGVGPIVMDPNRPFDMVSTNGPDGATKYWVDTFDDAPVFPSLDSTQATGTLRRGTSYVFGKARGRLVQVGGDFNHWWLRTDPDVGEGQWVSAYYLSRWGNDEARDNTGAVIPDA